MIWLNKVYIIIIIIEVEIIGEWKNRKDNVQSKRLIRKFNSVQFRLGWVG